MSSPQREQLETAVLGYQKTFSIRIKHRGEYIDGGNYETPTILAWDESGNVVTPTGAWVTPQTGDDLGALTVVYTGAMLDAAGIWAFDVFLALTGGNVEPITRFYQFRVVEAAP